MRRRRLDDEIQENLPIKIAVFDNGKLGFVEIEQKTEGMLKIYTARKNKDFGKVARAMGSGDRPPTRRRTSRPPSRPASRLKVRHN